MDQSAVADARVLRLDPQVTRPGDPPDLHFDDFEDFEDTEVEMLEMPDDNELGRGRLYFLYLGDQFAGFPKVVKLDPAPGK